MTESHYRFCRIRTRAAMRSCALRILLAATISIARVIFCVFLILAILSSYFFTTSHGLCSDYQLPVFLKLSDCCAHTARNLIIKATSFINFSHQLSCFRFHIESKCRFKRTNFINVNIINKTFIRSK